MIKRILLVLALLSVPGIANAQFSNCNNPSAVINVSVSVSTATTTLIVTGTSTRAVQICSVNLVIVGTATANTLVFKSGTGATCGTGTTILTGPFTGAATAGVPLVLAPNAPFGLLVTGDSLCLTTTQAGVVAGNLVYVLY